LSSPANGPRLRAPDDRLRRGSILPVRVVFLEGVRKITSRRGFGSPLSRGRRWSKPNSSCPALVPGIHAFQIFGVVKDVDGLDKPGHDDFSLILRRARSARLEGWSKSSMVRDALALLALLTMRFFACSGKSAIVTARGIGLLRRSLSKDQPARTPLCLTLAPRNSCGR
jgi:hypothetical protein